jgi:hypothetical protein
MLPILFVKVVIIALRTRRHDAKYVTVYQIDIIPKRLYCLQDFGAVPRGWDFIKPV